MREHPILFSGEMVRAILDGPKTQTRRAIKPQPSGEGFKLLTCMSTTGDKKHEGRHHWAKLGGTDGLEIISDDGVYFASPYGKPGDRLWVQEAFTPSRRHGLLDSTFCHLTYKADGFLKYNVLIPATHWHKPSSRNRSKPLSGRFMPRWASRILLEVTDVRVERVQEISNADIISEGIIDITCDKDRGLPLPILFLRLWDSINEGRGFGWDVNPWVWVIEFKRLR